ncbi:MAG: hypothetical protein KC414_15580 [Romboutsia sp.]|nr:hypothetical protein [Romboutsia sp.]
MISNYQILKNELEEKGVVDVEAALLYLFAIEHELDISKIKISKADILRIGVSDNITEEVQLRYQEYRDLFKGLKPGAEGDKQAVIRNLIRFIKSEKYTFDEILQYTKEYIDSKFGELKYIRQADYFLYKVINGTKTSTLKEFINNSTVGFSNTKII